MLAELVAARWRPPSDAYRQAVQLVREMAWRFRWTCSPPRSALLNCPAAIRQRKLWPNGLPAGPDPRRGRPGPDHHRKAPLGLSRSDSFRPLRWPGRNRNRGSPRNDAPAWLESGNNKPKRGKGRRGDGDLVAGGRVGNRPDLAWIDGVRGNVPVLGIGVERHAEADLAVIRRYIQPAEPVYQVQPPRPVWGRRRRRRRRRTARLCTPRSARRGAVADRVDHREQLPGALASPMSGEAMTVQMAAWVYWPPFSRTPGT
jgi:hypothetical protein